VTGPACTTFGLRRAYRQALEVTGNDAERAFLTERLPRAQQAWAWNSRPPVHPSVPTAGPPVCPARPVRAAAACCWVGRPGLESAFVHAGQAAAVEDRCGDGGEEGAGACAVH
jgi:hypothetical protein